MHTFGQWNKRGLQHQLGKPWDHSRVLLEHLDSHLIYSTCCYKITGDEFICSHRQAGMLCPHKYHTRCFRKDYVLRELKYEVKHHDERIYLFFERGPIH